MQQFRAQDGRALSYSVSGEGPLVVMLPGGPGMDPTAYFSEVTLAGYQLLIFCPRGVGDSDPPATPNGYRIGGYASDLEELRVHLGLDTLTLYGNSHGAMIALAYAQTHPGRVARMVLVNGPARIDDSYRSQASAAQRRFAERAPNGSRRLEAAAQAETTLDEASSNAERQAAFRTVMDRYVVKDDPINTAYLDRLCAAPMNFEAVGPMYQEMMDGLDLLARAADVSAPTLVLAGTLDATVPAEHMRDVAAALPNSTYLEFEGAGHFVEVEAAEQWTRRVSDFLSAAKVG